MSSIVERGEVLSKSGLAALLLLILAGIESCAYIRLQTSHSAIVSSYEALKVDSADLQNQYDYLDGKYQNLTSDYEDLSRDHLLSFLSLSVLSSSTVLRQIWPRSWSKLCV